MPVVPEKLSSRHGSRSAIASQFWECAEHSTRYLDGQAWELPCEPPALNLTGSSGLSRSQQLIAAQSLGVPVFPSFDGNSGGLVMDRVLANFGGRRWWTALSGRVKAQRMYQTATAGGARLRALQDLGSYALCARARIQVAPRLTFNGVVEAPDALLLRDRLKPVFTSSTNVDGPDAPATSATRPVVDTECVSAHAQLRASLPGHDLTACVARNMDYVESSGDYVTVPLAVSLDLSSLDRADGLQYRVGMHQVTAPPTEAPVPEKAGAGGVSGIATRPGALPSRMRTVLYAQGAVAVEGEAFVWRGAGTAGEKPAAAAAPASTATTPAAAERDGQAPQAAAVQSGEPTSSEGGEEDRPAAGRVSSALATAAAADSGERLAKQGTGVQDTVRDGSTVPLVPVPAPADPETAAPIDAEGDEAPATAAVSFPSTEDGAAASDAAATSLESFMAPLGQKLGDALDAIHAATHPSEPSSLSPPLLSTEAEQQPATPPRVIPVTSQSISEAITESLAALRQLKETVGRVTAEVQDGSLQRLSEQLSMRQAPRRRPYSMLLAQPHVKLNAALGCLARMPLPPFRGLALDGPPAPAAPSHRRSASTSSALSRTSVASQLAEAWEPYLKGTALRVFASAGVSGQLGRFTRPFLDYTAASLRLDVGLTSPHVVGSVPGIGAPAATALDEASRPDKHRAFALEGRGSWHALSVSLAQQILGPVRARADFRFALDPTNVPQDQGERSTLKGLAQTALSARPSLLEAVYGADMVLPGTEGAARLAVWWSPKRREAMAELRLF